MQVTATEFKAKCLRLLDQVAETGETIEVTKRGKVVAYVKPPFKRSKAGFAEGEMVILGDIISPLDVEWEAMK